MNMTKNAIYSNEMITIEGSSHGPLIFVCIGGVNQLQIHVFFLGLVCL